jgi:poly(3-hydroxybutyrate) depolymerase
MIDALVRQVTRPLFDLARRKRRFLDETVLSEPPAPAWTTPNRVVRETPAMRLREFVREAVEAPPVGAKTLPMLVVPPEVNRSTIADFGPGQSLVRAMLDAGFSRVAAVEWRSADEETAGRDIDDSIADIRASIAQLGGRVHLVGLCQGGWESAVVAALAPDSVASLTLVASPIDFHAGSGPVKHVARLMPLAAYRLLVHLGEGRMRGELISAGFDGLAPLERFVVEPLALWSRLDDEEWMARWRALREWYRSPKDLPGPAYLRAVKELFKENRLIRGTLRVLGERVDLSRITCPLALVAGEKDHITPAPQVFAAQEATRSRDVLVVETPGGHVGAFMGREEIAEYWPKILEWLRARDRSGATPLPS